MEQRLAARQRPPGPVVMRQRWNKLLFLHWPLHPALIQSRLPPGLHVDTFGGSAWLGVVPFFMERVRPVLLPPVPKLSWFLELNVRTYVHDDSGRPGVWFFSLDCDQPVAVELARRLFHLPYEHAEMNATVDGGRVSYHARRLGDPARQPAHYQFGPAEKPAPAAPGTLDWFLVERYLLFAKGPGGNLFSGAVHHFPYHIARADCPAWSAEPLAWDGFPVPHGPPASMLIAEPVDVKIFPPRRVRAADGLLRDSAALAWPASA
jgi:uncharacterized protein